MIQRFPFSTTLDFSPLVAYWRDEAVKDSSPWQAHARSVLARTEAISEFHGPLDDASRLAGLTVEVELLLSAFHSPGGRGRVAAVMTPFMLQPAYVTDWASAPDLPAAVREHLRSTYLADELADGMALKAYARILNHLYGVELGFELPFSWVSFRDLEGTVPIPCPDTGLTRRYAIDFDPRFVGLDLVDRGPEVDPGELQRLQWQINSTDMVALPRLLELFPPRHFAFHGLSILLAEDVTTEAALTAIRDDLLLRDTLTTRDGILQIQEYVRAFMEMPELELGLIGVGRGLGIEAIAAGSAVGRSLLMNDDGAPWCPNRSESLYARALEAGHGLVTEDLESCGSHTGYESRLLDRGLRAMMIHPLFVDGELVGMLELGAREPGALTAVNFFKLEKLEAVFALGLRRALQDHDDQVQAIIKREYTAIHPVVEWRFREAARKRLEEPDAPATEIVFQDLHPLYGLTDIRDSSTRRNEAITEDLRTQLLLARDVVAAAQSVRTQPALGEIEFRIDDCLDSLHPGMASEDESSVLSWLQREFEPLLERLQSLDGSVGSAVTAYRDALDPELGVLYRKRRDFEESVSCVNDVIAGVLHAEEEEGQELVPHYFELFKTDGVDYNIYLGASLHRDRRHDPLDLGNLRLWQLMAHVKIDRALKSCRKELAVPLRVTHLILAQNTPLAIRFRRDERRFDVDGAYNIRYEIVKKRIDKAIIDGSEERLTQPGTLAVAYSQDREAHEYRQHIAYLQRAGYLEPGPIEELELEPMQGVFGLRALRVAIAGSEDDAADGPADASGSEGPRLMRGA